MKDAWINSFIIFARCNEKERSSGINVQSDGSWLYREKPLVQESRVCAWHDRLHHGNATTCFVPVPLNHISRALAREYCRGRFLIMYQGKSNNVTNHEYTDLRRKQESTFHYYVDFKVTKSDQWYIIRVCPSVISILLMKFSEIVTKSFSYIVTNFDSKKKIYFKNFFSKFFYKILRFFFFFLNIRDFSHSLAFALLI